MKRPPDRDAPEKIGAPSAGRAVSVTGREVFPEIFRKPMIGDVEHVVHPVGGIQQGRQASLETTVEVGRDGAAQKVRAQGPAGNLEDVHHSGVGAHVLWPDEGRGQQAPGFLSQDPETPRLPVDGESIRRSAGMGQGNQGVVGEFERTMP